MKTYHKLLKNQLLKGTLYVTAFLLFISCKNEVSKPVEVYVVESSFSFPRSTPESQGISSQSITQLLSEIKKSEIQFHSLMILRHGHVIAETWWVPYAPNYKHQLYSLSKSFASTAIGFAVKEGLLSVDDKVISFFPDDLPNEVSENLKKLSIKHLLTMSVGNNVEPLADMRNNKDVSWVKTFLAAPIENEPGTIFLYNTAATYMLSAIIKKVTGEKLVDYLKPRLFDPLNIENYDWMESPDGINTGGYGLRVKTEDIAKLGQLYLQKGAWNGKQLLTKEWTEEATSSQIKSSGSNPNDPPTTDWSKGYGYQFWRSIPGGFRADGAFGQFSLIIPEKDLVVAITGESFDTGKSMKLVWDNLLPGISDAILPENITAETELKNLLNSLSIKTPTTSVASTIMDKISNKKYSFESNDLGADTISFEFKDDSVGILVNEGSETVSVDCGINKWIIGANEKKNASSLFPVSSGINFPSKIAANAVWLSNNTLQLTWRFLENVHGDQLTCVFEGKDFEKVTISFMYSIAKGNNQEDSRKQLIGISN